MFYNESTTQNNFELLVVIALLLNLLVFLTITFKPTAIRSLSNWAMQTVDRIWKGLFPKH